METAAIRYKLHQYIDNSDSKLLKLMYALAREYKEEGEGNIADEFNESDIERYEIRRAKRLNGESKIYDWSDAKKMITGK
jgi:hypothetical protein